MRSEEWRKGLKKAKKGGPHSPQRNKPRKNSQKMFRNSRGTKHRKDSYCEKTAILEKTEKAVIFVKITLTKITPRTCVTTLHLFCNTKYSATSAKPTYCRAPALQWWQVPPQLIHTRTSLETRVEYPVPHRVGNPCVKLLKTLHLPFPPFLFCCSLFSLFLFSSFCSP